MIVDIIPNYLFNNVNLIYMQVSQHNVVFLASVLVIALDIV